MTYIGIDGCKAGWLAWIAQHGKVRYEIHASLDALFTSFDDLALSLIDMPIGYASKEHPDRLCDKAARALLKERRSSVFSMPCREAIFAADYGSACEINARKVGKKLSKQTWMIAPKIRELDKFVRANAQLPIRESHPEVVFAAIAGQPMQYSKKTRQGQLERLGLINSLCPEWLSELTQAIASTPKKVAEADDFIDAFVLLLAACHQHKLRALPHGINIQPKQDGEIVYWPRAAK